MLSNVSWPSADGNKCEGMRVGGLEASMGRNWMAIKAASLSEADRPMADKECRYHFVGLFVCV